MVELSSVRVVNVGLPRTPRNFGVTESWKTTEYVSAAEPGASVPEPPSEASSSAEVVTHVFHGVPPLYSGPDTPRFCEDPPVGADASSVCPALAELSSVVPSVGEDASSVGPSVKCSRPFLEFESVEDPIEDLLQFLFSN